MTTQTIDMFYSPSQPRDGKGKWAKTGGYDPKAPEAHPEIAHRMAIREQEKRNSPEALYRAKHGPVTTLADGRMKDILTNGDLESKREAYGIFRKDMIRVVAESTGMDVKERESSSLVALTLSDPKNEEAWGIAKREIDISGGELTVHHERLEFTEEARGQGIGSAMDKATTEYYKSIGVDRIRLIANIDVGGYAWARLGYDFYHPEDAQIALIYMDRHATTAPKYLADRAAVEAKIAKFKASGNEADNATAFEVSQIGREPGMTTWPGKEQMLTQEWQAVRQLNPVPERTEMSAHVSRETAMFYDPSQPRGADGRWSNGARRATGQPERTATARALLAEGKNEEAIKASFGDNVRTVSLNNWPDGILEEFKRGREALVAETLVDLNEAYPGVKIGEISITRDTEMPSQLRNALGGVQAMPRRNGLGDVDVKRLIISTDAFNGVNGGPESAAFGWSFVKDAKGVVVHEFGHALQYSIANDLTKTQRPDQTWQVNTPQADAWVAEWTAAHGRIMEVDTSRYGMTNHAELVAESFADHHLNGKDARPMSAFIAGKLLDAVKTATAPPRTALAADVSRETHLKYNPDQPRDAEGQWAKAGGSATDGLRTKFHEAVPGLDSLEFERSEEDSAVRVTARRGADEAALTMSVHREIRVERVGPTEGSVELAVELDKGFRAAKVYGGIRNPEVLRQARRALRDGWTEGEMPVTQPLTHDQTTMSPEATVRHFEATTPVSEAAKSNVEAYVTDGMTGEAPILNTYLRGGGTGNQIYSDRVAHLSSAIDAQPPAPEAFTVYRGVNHLPDIDITGTSLEDAGFTSATLLPNVATRWIGNTGGLMEITVPKGAKALSVNRVEDPSLSVTTSEAELLFAPGARFRVLHDTVPRPGGPRLLKILMEGPA